MPKTLPRTQKAAKSRPQPRARARPQGRSQARPQARPARRSAPKAAAPKAAAPKPAAKRGSPFEALHDRLQQQRQDMVGRYKRDLRVGQENSEDGTEDIVDRANNSYHRELMLSLSDGERMLLLQIEDALARFSSGSYGKCVHCGQPIAMPRLQAIPWARLCIDCQELAEKGMLED